MARFRAMPYAKALHQVVSDKCPGDSEQVLTKLDSVAAAAAAVPDLQRVLVTPMVPPETKTAILDEVLDKLEVDEPTRAFVHVIQRHYRMHHISYIRDTFRDLVDRDLGRVRAKIEVAAPLDTDQQQAVEIVLAELLGASVIAEYQPNPDLLAGFRAKVGSKVFDGSIIGQLDQLCRKTEIEQAQVEQR